MLQQAYKLLRQESQDCVQTVTSDAYYLFYAQEKIRHSYQVMGAGNYLIRRIKWLQNKDSQYIDMVKSAVLLHDICRFAEIKQMYLYNNHIDHGVAGAEFLQQIPQFNDIRIWLPIKHHGHLIEALYDDPQYQNIEDKVLQEEVKQICFIIRDADKIANFHMLAYEENMHKLFFDKEGFNPQTDGHISAVIRNEIDSTTTLPRPKERTVADQMAGFMSWYYDLNYQYSLDFCDSLNVTDRLFAFFDKVCLDNDFKSQYVPRLKRFLASHVFLR